MNIKPLSDRVVIQRIEETTTAGGIVIPDSAAEKPIQGKVVAIGPGKFKEAGDGNRYPMSVSEGDTVLFGKYSGTEVKVSGHEYIVMREDDIMGIVA